MRNAESNADLRAALLWDVPVLRASTSPSARAFLEILNLREPPESFTDEAHPLGVAATALAAELQGDTEQAIAHYRSLTEDTGLASALGWALLAWAQGAPPDAFEGARVAAEAIDESSLRAHYYCKLMTFALDRGRLEEAEHFFDMASRDAGDSALGVTLRFVGANYFQRALTIDNQALQGQRDPLIELPWIHQAAEENARQTLVQAVVDRAESPWRRTIRFGQTVVQTAQAAELQATWAGAIWMLRSLRLQLGAQLLTGTSSPSEASLGVAMWVLGGGGSLSSVVQMAEANFDHDSADVLLNDHLARGRRLSSYHRYLEVARATWDLISDETAASVLTELRPSSSPDPDQELVRSVFAVLATRAPEVWAAQFNKLDPGTQVVLLDSLTPGAASFLSDQLIEALLQLAKGRLLTGNASENLYVLCAFLLRRSSSKERDNEVLAALRAARPEVVARLARMDLNLIGEEAVERAAQELGRQVLTENDEARTKGTTAIRSFNSRVRLGLALASLPSPPQDLTRALIETATDSSLPADYRLDALRGLMVVAQAGVLDPALAKQLSRLQPPAEPSWFSNVSGRLLEVAVRAVTALAAPREDDEVVLLGASRDTDIRIRDLAVETAAHLIQRRRPSSEMESSTLTISLFGALYDPSEAVLLDALTAVPTLFSQRLSGVLTERLQSLFTSSGRDVRAAVAQVVAQLSAKGTSAALNQLIDSATTDRSWKVRIAVKPTQTSA